MIMSSEEEIIEPSTTQEVEVEASQETNVTPVQEKDILNMSDEDILNLDESTLLENKQEGAEEKSDVATANIHEEKKEEIPKKIEVSEEIAEETPKETSGESIETKEPTIDAIDYKAEYERLTAPFKANDAQMHIDNVDEAIKLMQMGANYTKKMQALNPHLKIIKMLDNNDLLNEDKLNFLIDIDKKDPTAITKLLKDSQLDPLEIDVDSPDTYQQTNTYSVPDSEIAITSMLESIENNDSYDTTIDILANKWDDESRDLISKEPTIIKIIDDHVASGVYDQINNVVAHERMLGNLQGVSDLMAYKLVGESMQANGGQVTPQNPANVIPLEQANVPTNQNSQIAQRKKAASNTRGTVKTDRTISYDPLAMSDEEFEKVAANNFKI